MTVREIQEHLEEMYGDELSRRLISTATDAVIDEVKEWQTQPLDPIVPIVYVASCFMLCEPSLDSPNRYFSWISTNFTCVTYSEALKLACIRMKVHVKAAYLAVCLTRTGEKEVLGLWLAQTEGANLDPVTPTLYRRIHALIDQTYDRRVLRISRSSKAIGWPLQAWHRYYPHRQRQARLAPDSRHRHGRFDPA